MPKTEQDGDLRLERGDKNRSLLSNSLTIKTMTPVKFQPNRQSDGENHLNRRKMASVEAAWGGAACRKRWSANGPRL